MIIFLLIFICILTIIVLFTSRKLSPIPYFPSNKKDLLLILKTLDLRNNQTMVDLGAGDGIVIFEAAKQAKERNLNTQFIAVEINPILVFILQIRRLLHFNQKNIKILYADMFKFNVSRVIASGTKQSITVFLYISPWFMERIYEKLQKDLKTFELVSYFYPLPSKKPIKIMTGKNNIFKYSSA